MKKLQLSILLFSLLGCFSLLAQSENDPCSAPCLSPSGTTSGTNPPADGQSPNVNLPCGSDTSEDNPTWYTFVAGQPSFTLNANTSTCSSGSSIQVTIYEGDDCGAVTSIGCINCVTSGSINANTIPGHQYWIQVDGCAEAVCSYTLTYDPNSILKNIGTPTILGKTNTCVGSTSKYEAKLSSGLVPSTYNWVITPASAGTILSQDTSSVDIKWNTTGVFQLCATPKFYVKCPVSGIQKGCVTVTVNPAAFQNANCSINLCQNQLPYTVSLADCIKTTNPTFNEITNPTTFLIAQQGLGTSTNQISYTTSQGQCGGIVNLTSTVSATLNDANATLATYVNTPLSVNLKPVVLKSNPSLKGTITPSQITILEKKAGIYLKKIKYKVDSSGCEGIVTLKIWVIKKIGMLQDNPVSSKISNDSENNLEVETTFIASNNTEFAIYPNPSDGVFQLDFAKERENFNVRVFDSNSRLILENKNIKNIDLQAFSKGIYFVQVIDEMGNNWIERIVKQ